MPSPQLDLRLGATLPAPLRALYHSTAEGMETEFIACMDTLAATYHYSPKWLYSLPASRNTLASSLFHCLVSTRFALILQSRNQLPRHIIAQSEAHAQLLKTHLGSSAIITHTDSRIRAVCRALGNAMYQLARSLAVRFIARNVEKSQCPPSGSPRVLIDTFLIPGQSTRERYYPGLLAALSLKEAACIQFVPTLYGITFRNMRAFIHDIRKTEPHYLLREDHLTVGDLVAAWFHTIQGQLLPVPSVQCGALELRDLIRHELRTFNEFGAALAGHIAQRAQHRFAAAGIIPETLIDWYENQPVDRGWNLGAREAFPLAHRVGYQAFPLARLHLNLIPSQAEAAAGMVPHTLTPLGLFADRVKALCPAVAVEPAPSFRFSHLFAQPPLSASVKPEYDIFAPLPMARNEALHLLELILRLKERMPMLAIAVREHPATPVAVKTAARSAKGLVIPEGTFDETLSRSRILIGNGSSTCLEALLKGVYVIVINTSGLLMNPIPENVPSELYHVSFSFEDVLDHVRQALHAPDQSVQEKAQALLHKCMTPVTPETVRHFLRIPDTTL